MKDLDEFLLEFKTKETKIPESFTNKIKNFNIKTKERRELNMKINLIKKFAIIATSLLLGSGVVFAATQTYEKIWKEPETYKISNELTEADKKEAISEDEAKKKASDFLRKIGLENEVGGLELSKDGWNNEVIWNIWFENGSMVMNSKGEFESLNIPSYTYKIPYNYGITREEARKTAKALLEKYNPNDNSNQYELVSLKRNMETDEASYIWYADFYKKYDGLLNCYEKICIGWIPTINGLYSLRFESSKYENNEEVISKEEAIKIATEKDKQIQSKYKIKETNAEIWIDKMNADVTEREKNLEEYEKGILRYIDVDKNGVGKLKEDALFYRTENRVRKVWEVTLYYDSAKHIENGPDRYVYFVDCTTGEIIGGNGWSGAKEQTKNLMEDPYNLIEK